MKATWRHLYSKKATAKKRGRLIVDSHLFIASYEYYRYMYAQMRAASLISYSIESVLVGIIGALGLVQYSCDIILLTTRGHLDDYEGNVSTSTFG